MVIIIIIIIIIIVNNLNTKKAATKYSFQDVWIKYFELLILFLYVTLISFITILYNTLHCYLIVEKLKLC